MEIDLSEFDDSSKIWIYQSNRRLSEAEAKLTEQALDDFANRWVAHNIKLKAKALLVENQFILLVVDETMAGASGCSIDSSVHFLKSLQDQLGIDLFDRMQFAFIGEEGIQTANRTSFEEMYRKGRITDETIVVDTLIKTKKELPNLLKPLKESWHRRMV